MKSLEESDVILICGFSFTSIIVCISNNFPKNPKNSFVHDSFIRQYFDIGDPVRISNLVKSYPIFQKISKITFVLSFSTADRGRTDEIEKVNKKNRKKEITMDTYNYKLSQDDRNLAIMEPGSQTTAYAVSGEVFNPIQVHSTALTVPVAVSPINIITPEPPSITVSQVRPWTRYFARLTDIYLFSIIVGIMAALYAPSILNVPDVVLTIGILFAWVFQESILLTNCGTTPGKWLFKINVRDSRGRKLSFSDALNRSFSVLFKGFGAGVPFISLFALLSSKSKLKRDGITSWDEEGGYVVTHEKIGVARSIVIAAIIVAILSLIASV